MFSNARFRLSMFAALSALLLLAGVAQARTHRIPQDYKSLQVAVAFAVDGDTLLLAPGTYGEDPLPTAFGPTMLVLDKALTILGSSEGDVVLHGGYQSRILLAEVGASGSRLEGLQFRGGLAWAGGAIHQRCALLMIESCDFMDNSAERAGGAIFTGDGSVSCSGCLFDGNRSGDLGGGLLVIEGAADLSGCTLVGNDAERGGGLFIGPSGHVEMRQCIMVGDSAEKGGWVYVEDGFLYGVHCTFFGVPGDMNSGGIELGGEEGSAYLETSILCHSGRSAISGEREGSAMLLCCNLYGNVGGDWTGPVAAQEGIGGNISEDPAFCALLQGDFAIDGASPCAAENNDCGEVIGALGVGCPQVEEEDDIPFETHTTDKLLR